MNIREINNMLKWQIKKRILIFAAGEHTKQLIDNTILQNSANLIIVDKKKAGECISDYIIQDVEQIVWDKIDIVIISSFKYQGEIEVELKEKYKFKGEILKLYNTTDDKPFYLQKGFYENIQDMYISRITKLRKTNFSKLKVMFAVTQNALWNCQSLYDELDNNKLFDVKILALPNHEDVINKLSVSCIENYNFFKNKNMHVIMGYDIKNEKFNNLLELDCDILFLDQPYNIFDKYYSYERLARKYFLCYIPYGYKIAYAPEAHFNMKLQNLSWKVFCESQWHYEQFVKYGQVKGRNVVVSGYPKLDEYNNNRVDYSIWKNNDINRKRIIWAPHWSFRNEKLKVSTFDKNYKKFLEYARVHDEIDWIVKPHQRVFFWAVESGLMTKSEVEDYIREWNSLPNAKIYNEGMYMNIFKTSDALITDCGSFLAEYLPNNKPVIHLHNNGLKLNEIGKKIVDSYYEAYTFEDVKKYLDSVVLNGNDTKKKERDKVMNYVVPNINGAGKRIINEFINTFF